MRESFVMYTRNLKVAMRLSDAQLGQMVRAIYAKASDQAAPALDPVTDILFGVISEQMDVDADKYEQVVQKRKDGGKLGGRPPKEKEPEEDKNLKVSEKPKGLEKTIRQEKNPCNDMKCNDLNCNDMSCSEGIDNNHKKEPKAQPTPTPNTVDSDPEIPFRYGESQNVILTDMEHKRLVEKYGTRATDEYIERLSAYMDTSGKQYQGKHFSVLQQWMRKDNVPQVSAPISPSSDLYARALKMMEDHSA